jgi:hypothetical protein
VDAQDDEDAFFSFPEVGGADGFAVSIFQIGPRGVLGLYDGAEKEQGCDSRGAEKYAHAHQTS